MNNHKAPQMRAIYKSKRFRIKKVYPQNLDHSADAEMPIESGFEIIDHEGSIPVAYCTDADADALSEALKYLRKTRATTLEIDQYIERSVTSETFEIEDNQND